MPVMRASVTLMMRTLAEMSFVQQQQKLFMVELSRHEPLDIGCVTRPLHRSHVKDNQEIHTNQGEDGRERM